MSIVTRVSDPSANSEQREGLATDIIGPVIEDDFARPGAARAFLLYGPPGTRKTSMVASVAEALGWPLIVLSPPDFLFNGIERLEARAREVFSDLSDVRRVVVLFDECEEFFRRRVGSGPLDSRTAGAFITTGMLPRLQTLRDSRWAIFAIATNVELDELDPAVTRPGRLDIAQRVGLPSLDAQRRYLEEWRGGRLANHVSEMGGDWSKVMTGLDRYDRQVDDERRSLAELRSTAKRQRRTTGDWTAYQEDMARLRVRETEAPFVSFAKLDDLAKLLLGARSGDLLLSSSGAISDALAQLTQERAARSWSE